MSGARCNKWWDTTLSCLLEKKRDYRAYGEGLAVQNLELTLIN